MPSTGKRCCCKRASIAGRTPRHIHTWGYDFRWSLGTGASRRTIQARKSRTKSEQIDIMGEQIYISCLPVVNRVGCTSSGATPSPNTLRGVELARVLGSLAKNKKMRNCTLALVFDQWSAVSTLLASMAHRRRAAPPQIYLAAVKTARWSKLYFLLRDSDDSMHSSVDAFNHQNLA